MSTGPIPYMSNIPPWPVFIRELEQRGLNDCAEVIRRHLPTNPGVKLTERISGIGLVEHTWAVPTTTAAKRRECETTIHDPKRIGSIQTRVAVQLELLSTLEGKNKQDLFPQLQMARNQLQDIELFFIASLKRESMTLREEALWLDSAEYVLQVWTAELKRIKDGSKYFEDEAETIDIN